MNYYTADMSDDEFEANRKRAYEFYEYYVYGSGCAPSFSSGICESVTAGYGRLDYYGYWEYPLIVDQETLRIIPLESKP
jgi:hypothetical protein